MKLLISILFCVLVYQTVEAFDPINDVRLLLSTRRNVAIPQVLRFGDIESVRNSHFDRNKPTTFLIHGYLEGQNAISGLDTNTARYLNLLL
jgi:hypothetical protein